MRSTPAVTVRTLDPDEHEVIDLIATRMRLTLVEVLDEERADAMFDHDALVERVRWHLDRGVDGRRAEVMVAVDEAGAVVGHTMVRVDTFRGETVGLFATSYVTPDARRRGVATALLQAGERWMVDQGMATAMTFTDSGNQKLLAFYEQHGYTCEQIDDDWACARRFLSACVHARQQFGGLPST